LFRGSIFKQIEATLLGKVIAPAQGMLRDLRYALRTLQRNPGSAAVAIISLALGIGANSAIFSLADFILLRPLPMAALGVYLPARRASLVDPNTVLRQE
jgi:hypothetical protein